MYLSSYATLNSDCNSAKIESLGEYCTKSELTCASSQNDSVIWPSSTISSETFFAKNFSFLRSGVCCKKQKGEYK